MNKPVTSPPKPDFPLRGQVRAPGDKSISHRALILASLAAGTSHISGLLEGDDILHTAEAMRGFGAEVIRQDAGNWQVTGCGASGWGPSKHVIDFGNAGTGARLIMGAAAGFDIHVAYMGDASLSARPMRRILDPLSDMGAEFEDTDGHLPIRQTKGGNLCQTRYSPPHASAQVKSAILLAGLQTHGRTEVIEKTLTRDHTENMLRAFGCPVEQETRGTGQRVWIDGPASLKARDVIVPGDPSSAAFLIASALLVPDSEIIVKNVMLNPTRTGLFNVLHQMGAQLGKQNERESGGEVIADIHVRYAPLCGVDVPAHHVPSMVDEYPILAVIAATAQGRTTMRGLAELRVKESDRLQSTFDLLRANGVSCQIDGDDLIVDGGPIKGGSTVATHHDHRLAMSALVLGLASEKAIVIDDASMIATSFPDFFELMDALGARMERP